MYVGGGVKGRIERPVFPHISNFGSFILFAKRYTNGYCVLKKATGLRQVETYGVSPGLSAVYGQAQVLLHSPSPEGGNKSFWEVVT
jgi:hypothetical protein